MAIDKSNLPFAVSSSRVARLRLPRRERLRVATVVVPVPVGLPRRSRRSDGGRGPGAPNDRERRSDESLDLLQEHRFRSVAKRDGDAGSAGARGSADAVNVAFRFVRQIEVYDMRDIVDVEAAGGDVGGDQHARLAAAKALQGALPRALRFVAVDRLGANTSIRKMACNTIGDVLGAREHQNALERRLHQNAGQQRALLLRRDVKYAVIDVCGRALRRRHVDAHGLMQDRVRELLHVRRHRRREQHGLPLARQLGDDAADVADETHVEHAVGFVEHQHARRIETHVALFRMIEQTAGRGHEDIEARRERLDLRPLAHAADDDRVAQMQKASIGPDAVADLDGEFARRRQDQRTRGFRFAQLVPDAKPLQQRQRERGGLAGSGLRQTEQVLSVEQRRDGTRLDRRGLRIAFGGKRAPERLGDAERDEREISHE